MRERIYKKVDRDVKISYLMNKRSGQKKTIFVINFIRFLDVGTNQNGNKTVIDLTFFSFS